jgi:hypothetical protein
LLLFISLSFLFIRRKRQLKTTDESQEYRKAELEANPSTRAELPDSQGKEIVLITNSPRSNEIRELDSTPISAGQVQRKKPVASQMVVLPSNLRVADAVEGTFKDVEAEQSRGEPVLGTQLVLSVESSQIPRETSTTAPGSSSKQEQQSGISDVEDLRVEMRRIQERRRVLEDLRKVHAEDERLLREEERIAALLRERGGGGS